MGKHLNRGLPWEAWPVEDRELWTDLIAKPDIFDDSKVALWSASTRYGRRAAYAQYLDYVARYYPAILALPPSQRACRELVSAYAEHLLRTSRETSASIALARLAYVLTAICPAEDWSWIKGIANRIRRRARPLFHKIPPLEDLYALGAAIMDRSIAEAEQAGAVSEMHAGQFRDGLLMALLASIALRRGTLAGLTIGEELVRSGTKWVLDVLAEKTKSRRALEFVLSDRLSRYMDTYLARFRPALPAAATHDGLWPASVLNRPMPAAMIYRHVKRLTKQAFGFGVSPHRFRNAAATFLSVRDPRNVRVAADLLDHKNFRTTEKHYIQAQSQLAGEHLAAAISRWKSRLRLTEFKRRHRPQQQTRPIAGA